MAERCSWSDRVAGLVDGPGDETARHMESCPSCRAEGAAHDELVAAFRGAARPALSPHFRPQLMRRLKEERRRRHELRRRLVALRLYWLCAAIACAAVIVHLGWLPSDPALRAPVLLAIALFAVPIGALLIALRTNPVELVIRTLTGGMEEPASGL